MIGRRIATVSLVLILTATMACSGSDATTSPSSGSTAPERSTTPTDAASPGHLLSSEPLDAASVDGSVWRVRYRSIGVGGEPVEVTGLVAQPSSPPPSGGYPIVSWAHGTTGIADRCAPSSAGASSIPNLQHLLDDGYVVAATDYEGLGTPGVHPYLVADSEARGVLDAARAARQLVPDTSARLLVAGHSQGGHAALATAEIAASWAPELDLLGTVALAPAADLRLIVGGTLRPGGLFGFGVLVAAGWSGAYADLSADDLLTPAGLDIAHTAETDACVPGVFAAVAGAEGPFVSVDPTTLPAWKKRIDENTIHPADVAGPLLVLQGTSDPVVAKALTDRTVGGLCAAGAPVSYRTYDGVDHAGVVSASWPDAESWMRDRLDGVPAPTTCN